MESYLQHKYRMPASSALSHAPQEQGVQEQLQPCDWTTRLPSTRLPRLSMSSHAVNAARDNNHNTNPHQHRHRHRHEHRHHHYHSERSRACWSSDHCASEEEDHEMASDSEEISNMMAFLDNRGEKCRDVFTGLLNKKYDRYDQASLNMAIMVNSLDHDNVENMLTEEEVAEPSSNTVSSSNNSYESNMAIEEFLLASLSDEFSEEEDCITESSGSMGDTTSSSSPRTQQTRSTSRSRSRSGGSSKKRILKQQIKGLYQELFLNKDIFAEIQAANNTGRGKYADSYTFELDEYNIIRPKRKEVASTTVTASRSTQQPVTTNDNASLCTVCFENPKDVLFMTCGHVTICQICLFEMIGMSLDQNGQFAQPCPSCRTPVTKCLDVIIQ